MRVLSKCDLREIKQYIVDKAKYQKIIICVDETSDRDMIKQIQSGVSRDVVVLKYEYSSRSLQEFNQMLNNGVRLVIYNISTNHFCKLHNANNLILNIYIPTSEYVLPYMVNPECVFGDNILICVNRKIDYAGMIVLYYAGICRVWADLQAGEKVDLNTFKELDGLINKPNNFYNKMIEHVNLLLPYIDLEIFGINEADLPYNIYLRTCAILAMLRKVESCEWDYVDFYKTHKSHNEILKAHKLIVGCQLMDLIKYYSNNLIKLNMAILSRFKIILKKYFTPKNIDLNNINKNIKNVAKVLKIDNLLYISYILNSI